MSTRSAVASTCSSATSTTSTRKDAYLESIATYARTHPDEPWILGGGWSQDVFPRGCPAKEDIDAIVSDRPVFLPNRDGHSAWVNSKALEIAGITADTPDPADGRIERNADGSPQGTLHEGAADTRGGTPAGAVTRRRSTRGSSRASRTCTRSASRAGRTRSWTTRSDMGTTRRILPRPAEGDAHGSRRGRPVVGTLARPGADRRPRRAACGGNRRPVLRDQRQDHAGRRVRELHRRHDRPLPRRARPPDRQQRAVVGRSGVAEGGRDASGCARLPGALPRARRSRGSRGAGRDRGRPRAPTASTISATISRTCRSCTPTTSRSVPPARRARERAAAVGGARGADGRADDPVPRRAALDAGSTRSAPSCAQGATLVMGTDWPVSTPDPMAEMHVAVNRKMPADYAYRVENHDVFLPDERIDLATSIAAFTMGSAYVNHLRARHGLDRGRQVRRPRRLRPQPVRPSGRGDLRRTVRTSSTRPVSTDSRSSRAADA